MLILQIAQHHDSNNKIKAHILEDTETIEVRARQHNVRKIDSYFFLTKCLI